MVNRHIWDWKVITKKKSTKSCYSKTLKEKKKKWSKVLRKNTPTSRLVWAAKSLLSCVQRSFSPASPLIRLEAVCILCRHLSASSSKVWEKRGRDVKKKERLILPLCTLCSCACTHLSTLTKSENVSSIQCYLLWPKKIHVALFNRQVLFLRVPASFRI